MLNGKKIIIKADDILKDGYSNSWKYFLDGCYDLNVPIMLGIVGEGVPKHYKRIPNKYFEHFGFFAHGFSHFVNRNGLSEYKGTSMDYQKNSINSTIETIKKYINIEVVAFGAPGNAVDNNTVLALSEIKQITHIFYKPIMTQKVVIKRNFEFEYASNINKYRYYLGLIFGKYFHYNFNNLNYQKLINFTENSNFLNEKLICPQIHPEWWSKSQLKELFRYFEYLKVNGVDFVKLD